MRTSLAILLLPLAIAAFAPTGAHAQQEAASAAAPAEDEVLVVDEKDLDRMWVGTEKSPVQIKPNMARGATARLDAGCVTIGYVIETDGRVRTANVLRSDPPGVLDAEGLRTARTMRFRPGPDNPSRVPVYSVVSWSVGRGTERTVAGALAPCLVDIEVPR